MMKLTAITTALLPLASAFTAAPSARFSTSLNHIDTRHRSIDQEIGIWTQHCVDDASGNYVPCDAICGHDVRSSWESYAKPTNYHFVSGEIGCPGGGDWCYASSFGGARAYKPDEEMRKKAATVAAALAGLGSGVGGARSDVGLNIPKGASGVGGGYTPQGSVGNAPNGHDIRGARSSYAKPTNYHFVTGEIGLSQGGSAPAAAAARPAARGPRKSYGLGSWQK